MNEIIKREYEKIQEAVEELIEGGEDWVDGTLREAFQDVVYLELDEKYGFELEEFVKKNGIKDIKELMANDKFDDETKQEMLEKWAESLGDLTDIEVQVSDLNNYKYYDNMDEDDLITLEIFPGNFNTSLMKDALPDLDNYKLMVAGINAEDEDGEPVFIDEFESVEHDGLDVDEYGTVTFDRITVIFLRKNMPKGFFRTKNGNVLYGFKNLEKGEVNDDLEYNCLERQEYKPT